MLPALRLLAARLQEGALSANELPRLLQCVTIADAGRLGEPRLLAGVLADSQRFLLRHVESMEQDLVVEVVQGLQALEVDCTPLL